MKCQVTTCQYENVQGDVAGGGAVHREETATPKMTNYKAEKKVKLPASCTVPYFHSSELVGERWAEFRIKFEEQQKQFKLTDEVMVRLLTEACSVHPKLRKYLCDTLCPGSTMFPTDRLVYMGSSWLLATMNNWAVVEKAKIIAQLKEKTETCGSVDAKSPYAEVVVEPVH